MRGISFSPENLALVYDGTKTETRRPVKQQPRKVEAADGTDLYRVLW